MGGKSSLNLSAAPLASPKAIGLLALQGGFAKHRESLRDLGVNCHEVRNSKQLNSSAAIVLPGGESTALLRLLDATLKNDLRQCISQGLPTLATCAGTILIAREVTSPAQESLDILDITVQRNAYGRQIDSFVSEQIELTTKGQAEFFQHGIAVRSLSGVFIRAPRISRVGPEVEVLAVYRDEPVLVRYKKIIAATFHPELGAQPSPVHQLLLAYVGSD